MIGNSKIIAINYADQGFRKAQRWNSQTAKEQGADLVIEYGPQDLSAEFRQKNHEILQAKKGGGYYVWKPYVLNKAFEEMGENDYVIYTDSGAIYVDRIEKLIQCMEQENLDIMVFSLENEMLERKYTKRDAFILLECDAEKYIDTPQTIGGYVVFKKTDFVKEFLQKDLEYAQDIRAISDQENQLGKENHTGFITHRHDQSVWSLMVKKYEIPRFRDPSQFGMKNHYEKEVEKRSTFPQIVYSHRQNVQSMMALKVVESKVGKFCKKVKNKLQRSQ